MDYKKGDRVKHPTREDWGLGEVLEDSAGNILRVFFTGVGEKRLSLKFIQPAKVQGKEANDEVLDSLARKGADALGEEILRANNRETRPPRDYATSSDTDDAPDALGWEDEEASAYDEDDDYEDDFDSDDL